MDEDRVEALGAEPIADDLAAIAALTDVDGPRPRCSAGSSARASAALVDSYVNTDDRQSDRYIVNLVQGGIGLPDESYYREDAFAELRAAYVGARRRDAAAARPDRRRRRRRAPHG